MPRDMPFRFSAVSQNRSLHPLCSMKYHTRINCYSSTSCMVKTPFKMQVVVFPVCGYNWIYIVSTISIDTGTRKKRTYGKAEYHPSEIGEKFKDILSVLEMWGNEYITLQNHPYSPNYCSVPKRFKAGSLMHKNIRGNEK